MNKSAPNDYSAMNNQFNYSLNNNLSIMPPQNNFMSSNSFDKYDMFNNNTHF